jgi:hypothetical protein
MSGGPHFTHFFGWRDISNSTYVSTQPVDKQQPGQSYPAIVLAGKNGLSPPFSNWPKFREMVAGFGHIFDVQFLLDNVTPN